MRLLSSGLLVVLVGAAACKGEPFRPDAGPRKDAFEPAWFSPKPGDAKDWDIQLNAPFDLSVQRTMMVLPLWDVVPSAQMMTYEDGSTVTVPPGAQATAIADLHAKGTVVICHVNTGALRLDEPDAAQFPGADSPPMPPALPPDGTVVGWPIPGEEANEHFIDVRAAARATVLPLITARIALAKAIGCDGILADHNTAVAYEPPGGAGHGFGTIDITEHTSWNVAVAAQAHQRELSIGVQNGHYVSGLEALIDDFDWILVERCAEYDECDKPREFIIAEKAVFAIDYTTDDAGEPQAPGVFACQRWPLAMIQDGIIKTAALDGSTRESCATQ